MATNNAVDVTLSGQTGTGNFAGSTSPTFVTPAIGTPTSGVLTNCSGLPISSGVSGLAAGIATFLATPSSANLAAALTDETGTGANVFANTPTLVSPILGTPTSGTLTNCSGLPLTTGVTGILPLANGGSNANLTASNGGIVYSNATQMQILSGTATAGQLVRSASSAAPTWTTSTYPATNSANTLLYASAANTMSELATANNGALVTSNTGVPSILVGPGAAGRTLLSQAAAAPIWSTGQAITRIAVQILTVTGTYTPTSGMIFCNVEVIGGGGGGGGAGTSGAANAAIGSAGGGGGYTRKLFTAATIGASQPFVIGAAGTAGAAGNNAGGSGGQSSFGTGGIIIATGGSAGAGGAPSTGAAYAGAGGGQGAGGDFNTNGTPGNMGFSSSTIVMGGNGGSTFFGGGASGKIAAGAGNTGLSYGGGGTGGATANSAQQAGGAGFAGVIVVTEFINI